MARTEGDVAVGEVFIRDGRRYRRIGLTSIRRVQLDGTPDPAHSAETCVPDRNVDRDDNAPRRVRFAVNYSKMDRRIGEIVHSHSINEVWEQTGHHCPACGELNVWRSPTRDDYYQGSPYLCAICGAEFWTQGIDDSSRRDDQVQQRLDQIRNALGLQVIPG